MKTTFFRKTLTVRIQGRQGAVDCYDMGLEIQISLICSRHQEYTPQIRYARPLYFGADGGSTYG